MMKFVKKISKPEIRENKKDDETRKAFVKLFYTKLLFEDTSITRIIEKEAKK